MPYDIKFKENSAFRAKIAYFDNIDHSKYAIYFPEYFICYHN